MIALVAAVLVCLESGPCSAAWRPPVAWVGLSVFVDWILVDVAYFAGLADRFPRVALVLLASPVAGWNQPVLVGLKMSVV